MREHIVIVGAGLFGEANAAVLSKYADVTVLEAWEIGHIKGSSHGGERIIRPPIYEGEKYIRMQQVAAREYRDLSRRTKKRILFNRLGFQAADLQTTIEDFHNMPDPARWLRERSELDDVCRAWAETRSETLSRNREPHTVMRGEELLRRSGGFYDLGGVIAILQSNMGEMDLFNTRAALRVVAQENGAKFHYNTPVESIDYQLKQVKTKSGQIIHADKLVLAGNGGNNWLLRNTSLQVPVRDEQRNLAYFRIKQQWMPPFSTQWAAPARLYPRMPSTFIHSNRKGTFFGMFSYGEGLPVDAPSPFGYMKIGQHDLNAGYLQPGQPYLPVTDADIAPLVGWVKEHLPHVDPNPVYVTPCKYSETQDGHLRFGQHPDYDWLAVINACCGHGAKFSTAIALAVREMFYGTSCGYDRALFGFDPRGDELRAASPMPR